MAEGGRLIVAPFGRRLGPRPASVSYPSPRSVQTEASKARGKGKLESTVIFAID